MSEEAAGKETDLGRWEERARLLRTIAQPIRLMILESLCEGPQCVADINALIAIPQPHLSQHIAALREAKLIACHVNGSLRCYYILKPTLVRRLIRLLSAEHAERERDRAAVIREARRRRESRGPKPGSANRTGG
ncbi:MAG: winged helix-turn-helix transcriptional regulator [Thermogutta sp.]|nr:winged helix-turn-helix transcriptional regulator [Thermogutta sp.]